MRYDVGPRKGKSIHFVSNSQQLEIFWVAADADGIPEMPPRIKRKGASPTKIESRLLFFPRFQYKAQVKTSDLIKFLEPLFTERRTEPFT